VKVIKYIYKRIKTYENLLLTLQTTITQSGLTATIDTKGAELVSLKNNTNGREYIWEGNPDFWGKHSPVLFPIVGTLKNGSYTFNNQSYALPRHGFARDCHFELIEKAEDKAVFSLKSNAESLQKFPFKFELQISYAIQNARLSIGYKIINNEDFTMPFSIGAHPAFALPEKFESYALQLEKAEDLQCFELQDDLLSNTFHTVKTQNGLLPLTYSLFEKDALIIKKMQSKSITILENNAPLLLFRFDDFPNFGIWTKPGAPFLCLEPWLGYSDTLHASGNLVEKEAIQLLDAKHSFSCRFSIEIL